MENSEPVPFGNDIPKDQRDWALIAHLSALAGYVFSIGALNFAGPLIVWLLKREEMPFVDDQGKESLNFQITVLLLLIISVPLCFVIIGFVLLPIFWIFGFIFTIIGGLKAQEGKTYRYPFTMRLIS